MTRNKRRIAECFQRGQHLARVEKDYDYANAMFSECVLAEPANLEYAEAMLYNLRASYNNERKKAQHRFRLSGQRTFQKTLELENWNDVFRLGVELLQKDPWNVPILRGLAQACEALHYNKVELAYLKQALESAPRNADVNRHCADSLARMGQFDQAIACWHRIEEITGGNEDAARMIAQLAEEKMKYPGGKPSATTTKVENGVETNEEDDDESLGAPSGIQIPPEIPLSPQQKLLRAIESDPADVSNYIEMARLQVELNNFDAARRTLDRAAQNCAQTALIEEALKRVDDEEVQFRSQAAELARRRARAEELKSFRMPWLEICLVFFAVALILQLVPSIRQSVFATWSAHQSTILIAANALFVIVLMLWRGLTRS